MNYQYAIVRVPPETYAEGLTTQSLGQPDYELTLKQHRRYRDALIKCGLDVLTMKPDPAFPDSCFVEDTAIVTEHGAIILNLGHRKRKGEQETVGTRLAPYKKSELLRTQGAVDGGDVLRADSHYFIGLSNRTDQQGADDLGKALAKWGFTCSTVRVSRVLHLKTGAAYLGDGNILTIKEFAATPEWARFKVHVVDDDEWYASNSLRVNDFVLVPAGFPKTKKLVTSLDYKVVDVDMSEFYKMDGSLSCLSLLF
ncbi:MAG: arginine deiminase family protein [Elusimicrobiota bacterium]